MGGLGTTYDVHLGLIGKRIVDFLLVLSELFFARCYGRGATSENRSKIGDFKNIDDDDGALKLSIYETCVVGSCRHWAAVFCN